MVPNFFYLIIITVFLNACAQLFIKKGVNSDLINLNLSNLLFNLDKVFFNPYILIGLFLMVLSMLTHIVSLSKFEVSFAFPFISISYVMVVLGGYFFFNENISLLRMTGLSIIVLGTIILAKS